MTSLIESFLHGEITHSESGDFSSSEFSPCSSLVVVCNESGGICSGNSMDRLPEIGEDGFPGRKVSLSLRVIRYQLKSSLLNTATISVSGSKEEFDSDDKNEEGS